MAIAFINRLCRAADLTGRLALTLLCVTAMALFTVAIFVFGPAAFGRWTQHLMIEVDGPN